jgi:amidase
MALFAGRVPTRNAPVVQRLLDAGAILLGKLKTTESACSLHHPSIPPPINPWNPTVWTGVSSSGSGVATAAGLCFGAIGTDTAGSIRFPSAANSLVGLKPTYDRVSTEGVFPFAPSLDHVGPMARSVRDAARMMTVLADPRGGVTEDFEAALGQDVRGLRIGIDMAYCERNVEPTLSQAVLRAARHLESLGAVLQPLEVKGIPEAVVTLGVLLHADTARVHSEHLAAHPDAYGPNLRAVIELGQALGDGELAAAREAQTRFRAELTTLLGSVDALLCPPAMTPPPPAALMQYVPSDFRDMGPPLHFTAPYTVAGVPSLTVPCGFTDEDVPLAFQLVGRPYTEAMLLRIGLSYEQSTEWHRRHPNL